MSDWILRFVEETGYLGVAMLMFIETVFPPIPSEVIMSIAGMHAGQGKMSLPLVIAVGTTGAMVGNYFWYLVARVIGIDRLRTMIERYGRWLTLDWPEVERARVMFDRYGGIFVCLGRMLPTLRFADIGSGRVVADAAIDLSDLVNHRQRWLDELARLRWLAAWAEFREYRSDCRAGFADCHWRDHHRLYLAGDYVAAINGY